MAAIRNGAILLIKELDQTFCAQEPVRKILLKLIQGISWYQGHRQIKLLSFLFAHSFKYPNIISCNEMMKQVTHRWDVKGSPRSTKCTADYWRTSSDPAQISWTQCSCLCCSNTPWGLQIQKSGGHRRKSL